MKNYIRKKLWKLVLLISHYDPIAGLTALRYFAAVYFIFTPQQKKKRTIGTYQP